MGEIHAFCNSQANSGKMANDLEPSRKHNENEVVVTFSFFTDIGFFTVI